MKNVLFLASVAVFLAAAPAVGAVAFGTTQTFEADIIGSQPDAWYDGDSGWYGGVQVVASGTDGVLASVNGGNNFVKITPGPPNSYGGGGAARNAPYSKVGTTGNDFPSAGNSFTVFRDVYFEPLADVGGFWLQNTIRSTGGAYLTESSFRFTTGEGSWNVQIGGSTEPGVTLATGQWYTFEEVWDRSQTLAGVTYNVYDMGGALLYTESLDTWNLVLSSDMGGSSAHSWFTVWNNDGYPEAVYADNFGTLDTVPEPATLAIWAMLGGLGLVAAVGRRWRA
ncbi:MAG: PEP-CTERM sorting domain-containing protein [Pirellulales bacterium]|nr:PEP-CTERM sorting domain-containing protein [Pirellulales bacterium]